MKILTHRSLRRKVWKYKYFDISALLRPRNPSDCKASAEIRWAETPVGWQALNLSSTQVGNGR